MRIEDLSVALRPRAGWEAVELGFALTRRHAATIYAAWLLCSLPVLLLLNLLAWPLDLLWLPPLLMWWLKPAFDRIPLYVISRGVFGQAPGLRETVAGHWNFAARSIWPWLLWRRLSPTRSLLYPVDALEGVSGAQRKMRRSALARTASGHAMLSLLVCLHLEMILSFSALGLLLMLWPIEFMGEAAKAMWDTLFVQPPPWATMLMNLLYWLSVTAVEPFYVGAGFGLYLNRRTQIEAWDIELGFRRLLDRLSASARPLALMLLAPLAFALATPDRAEALEPPEDSAGPGVRKKTLGAEDDMFRRVFAHAHIEGGDAFVDSVAELYAGPELNPVEPRRVWMPRTPSKDQPDNASWKGPAWLHRVFEGLALLFENILWLLAAALLVLVIATHRRWMPLLDGVLPTARSARIRTEPGTDPAPALPEDVLAATRALWSGGQKRAALALLYSASVARLVERSGEPLPPGSTEADCLRRARRLPNEPFAALLPRIVRCWQAAAYASRLPADAEFEALLAGYAATGKPSIEVGAQA